MKGRKHHSVFSQVVSWGTATLLLILSIIPNLSTRQTDFASAFVHADIDARNLKMSENQRCQKPVDNTAWELIVSVPTCVPDSILCLFPQGTHQFLAQNSGHNCDSSTESRMKLHHCLEVDLPAKKVHVFGKKFCSNWSDTTAGQSSFFSVRKPGAAHFDALCEMTKGGFEDGIQFFDKTSGGSQHCGLVGCGLQEGQAPQIGTGGAS